MKMGTTAKYIVNLQVKIVPDKYTINFYLSDLQKTTLTTLQLF